MEINFDSIEPKSFHIIFNVAILEISGWKRERKRSKPPQHYDEDYMGKTGARRAEGGGSTQSNETLNPGADL